MPKPFILKMSLKLVPALILCIILGLGSTAAAEDRCPDLKDEKESASTVLFKKLWDENKSIKDKTSQAPLTDEDLKKLNQYQILFVKGFLSDIVTESLSPSLLTGQYFDEQITYLKREDVLGKNVVNRIDKTRETDGNGERLEWGSQLKPKDNAKFLKWKINSLYKTNKEKKILIISHSKGGLDALHTLLDDDGSELLDNQIAGWISIQTPFEGTPIANQLGQAAFVKLGLEHLLEGHPETLDRMNENKSCNYLIKNKTKIEKMGEKINFLAFASWKPVDETSALAVANFAIQGFANDREKKLKEGRKRANNDGLVPAQSAILKIDGSHIGNFIHVKGFDHAVPVMPWHLMPKIHLQLNKFDELKQIFTGATSSEKDSIMMEHDIPRENFTRVLLKIWLENEMIK